MMADRHLHKLAAHIVPDDDNEICVNMASPWVLAIREADDVGVRRLTPTYELRTVADSSNRQIKESRTDTQPSTKNAVLQIGATT
jgi:hypothetical protein